MSPLFGQISPGKLSEAHAHLQGISNCTKCHILGKKVSNDKCLDCHETIQSFMNQGQGYHASTEVQGHDCFECHSEHHGRKFDMVRFDQEAFDHRLTGYELDGAHRAIDCRACHQPTYIADQDLRSRESTFLGLSQECASCHTDYHQNSLPNDCASCHNTTAFRPASGFNHQNTQFNLLGAHQEVDCIECHPLTSRNGLEFQEFANIPFDDCATCHQDAHNGQIEGTCIQCHTESSFQDFIGDDFFNHDRQTNFILKGKHQNLDCFDCHIEVASAAEVFQDQIGIQESQCIKCHQDIHEGKFGTNCAQCHQETSFHLLKSMDLFDHGVTDFPLEGRHIGVDCKECHQKDYLEPIDFSACQNCHEDYHNGEFVREDNRSPDCAACHTLFDGFEVTHYTIEQHNASIFPLEGSHLATPCFACHMKNEKWTFKDIGLRCIECHDDIHEAEISSEYYPEDDCRSCHNPETWNEVAFNHNLTEWPLDGGHENLNCRECHFELSDDKVGFTQRFRSLNSSCTECHSNIHKEQFANDGVTDCTRCHVTDDWLPERFNHDETEFPLEGKHVGVDCNKCHMKEMVDGSEFVNYQINSFECVDCHQ